MSRPALFRRATASTSRTASAPRSASSRSEPIEGDNTMRSLVWKAVGLLFGLTAGLGQTVYVENAAGASGNIGTQQFARSQPDGYTLLLATSTTNAASPALFTKIGF